MKKVFEMPSIAIENLQVNEAVMNSYWEDDPFVLGNFASANVE